MNQKEKVMSKIVLLVCQVDKGSIDPFPHHVALVMVFQHSKSNPKYNTIYAIFLCINVIYGWLDPKLC